MAIFDVYIDAKTDESEYRSECILNQSYET